MRLMLLTMALSGCVEYDPNLVKADASAPDSAAAEDSAAAGDSEPTDTQAERCVDLGVPAPEALSPDLGCQEHTEPGSVTLTERWAWSGSDTFSSYDQVISTPLVLDLDGDGRPEVVVVTHEQGSPRGAPSVLRALRGDTGEEVWSVLPGHGGLQGSNGLAAGQLDGEGGPEIVACTIAGELLALHADGTEAWGTDTDGEACVNPESYPALHDLDQDGAAEIVVGRKVFSAAGALLWSGEEGMGALLNGDSYRYAISSVAADVHPSPGLEVLVGDAIYSATGEVLWTTPYPDGIPAVGDVDGLGVPELVVVDVDGRLRVHDAETGALRAEVGDVECRERSGGDYVCPGGAPTLIDVDGDGDLEIVRQRWESLMVLDHEGALLWSMALEEDSYGENSVMAFDAEGDREAGGAAELVVADQTDLYILNGATGEVRSRWAHHSSGTILEHPVVADVDGDGEPEIVLGHNAFGGRTRAGVTALEVTDADWMNARPVYNQESFYGEHVSDSGDISTSPLPHWSTHNSHRAAIADGWPVHGQAELGVVEAEVCLRPDEGRGRYRVVVANLGAAPTPEEVVVTWSIGASGGPGEGLLGALQPGHSETVAGELVLSGDDASWRFTVDPDGRVEECDEENNVVELEMPAR